MLRPEMNLPERSEFSSQALLLIRFQILYFSQIPEWNKDPASRISVPFYPGNSDFFRYFLIQVHFDKSEVLLVIDYINPFHKEIFMQLIILGQLCRSHNRQPLLHVLLCGITFFAE